MRSRRTFAPGRRFRAELNNFIQMSARGFVVEGQPPVFDAPRREAPLLRLRVSGRDSSWYEQAEEQFSRPLSFFQRTHAHVFFLPQS